MTSESTVTGEPLTFHRLTYVAERDEVVVGRPDVGSYIVLPPDGAQLLRRLADGMTPGEADAWYQRSYGELLDVDEFVQNLREVGFVADAADAGAVAAPPRFRRLGRLLLSAPAMACYAAVVLAWIVVAARAHDVLPSPEQIFFTRSLVIVQVVITFGQVPLLFVHEGFHTLAGRRLGLPSRLGISNRLTYIVFETKMNGLLSVPRRQRYLPFLAGMLSDLVVFGLLGLVADLSRQPDGALSMTGRVCLAMAFTVAMRIAWQFQLYLRTDLYYVFATAFNCHDLHDASKALLWNRIWRLLRRPHRVVDEAQWSEHDRRVGRWYGPFLVVGVLAFVTITVLGSAPVAVEYFRVLFGNLLSGRLGVHFWDSAVSLLFNVAQLVAIPVLSRRKRRQAAGRPAIRREGNRSHG